MRMSSRIHNLLAVTCALATALWLMPACSGNSGPGDTLDPDALPDFGQNPCFGYLVYDAIDFGTVKSGDKVERKLTLFNTAACPVEIRSIEMDAADRAHLAGFSISIDGESLDFSPDSPAVIFPTPIIINPSSEVVWKVSFTPVDGDAVSASLLLHSNNAKDPDPIATVSLAANQNAALMTVSPDPVEFGGKLVGKLAGIEVAIESTGTQPLEIYGISLDEGSSSDFQLDLLNLGSFGSIPTPESPAVILPGKSLTFDTIFAPGEVNPRDESNNPIPDTGILHIENNGIQPSVDIPLSGYGVTVECPRPIIVIAEGEEIPTGTTLHISGSDSVTGMIGDTISKYTWSVNQPDENEGILLPSQSSPEVTHEVIAPGRYDYCLDVCDRFHCSSDPSCSGPMCVSVRAIASRAIECELTWNTPNDPDQFDEGENSGADMDLHFAHPFAATDLDLDEDGTADPWFDEIYDVWWFAKTQEWETSNPDHKDDPHLDRDDSDGAGPESVVLDAPVTGRVYSVGIHYYDDHGFGPSYPRLKCYIHGMLMFDYDMQTAGQAMYKDDMWYAARISWPQQTISLVRKPDNSLMITPDYPAPF